MTDNRNLRFIFVQLLFSLAIGQVAMKTSDLIVGGHGLSRAYAYSHLALCIVILTTSWVGYQISKSNVKNPKSIFSVPFVVLLLDVWLVISYFIIVRGAEISNYSNAGQVHPLDPDLRNETVWTCMIFFTYFAWDFVTKFFGEEFAKIEEGKYFKHYPLDFGEFYKRGKTTGLCCVIAVLIYSLARGLEGTNFNGVLIDLSLAFLFLFFRGQKQALHPVYPLPLETVDPDKKPSKESEEVEVEDRKYEMKVFIVKKLPAVLLGTSIILIIVIRFT
jgi:hypothetical protein